MKRRETPKSIERQLQICQHFGKTAELPEAEPYDYANMPDDIPSVEHWYKVRDSYLYNLEHLSPIGYNTTGYSQNYNLSGIWKQSE